MDRTCMMNRVMALLVCVSFLGTYSAPSLAGIVTTEDLLQQQAQGVDRASLLSALDRDDVRQQLVARGVSPDAARQRIAALSDAQVNAIAGDIDSLPAGAGVLEILIAVVLVLVILDVVGVTNIFSFIHPPSRR